MLISVIKRWGVKIKNETVLDLDVSENDKSTGNTNKQYVCNIVHIYYLNKINFYNSN